MNNYLKRPTDLDIKELSKKYKDEMLALYKKNSSRNSNIMAMPKVIPTMAMPQGESQTSPMPTTPTETPTAPASPSDIDYFGSLLVKVTTGNRIIPIEDAFIQIYEITPEGNILHKVAVTNRNGMSSTISLPTTNPALNEIPGQRGGFKDYAILVYKKGYERVIIEDIPVFSGISSFQNVNLIPIPALSYVPEEIEIDIPAPEL